jgi:hypothetical protein
VNRPGQPGAHSNRPQDRSSPPPVLPRVPATPAKASRVFEVLVFATVAALAATTLVLLAFVWSVSPRAGQPVSFVRPGEVFRSPGAASEPKTRVLIFARSTCSACRAEVPVYSALVVAAHDSGSFSVFLVSPEERSPATAFGREIGLGERYVVSGRSSALNERIRAVPTIVLLTAESVVQRVWQGRLALSDREELRTRLGLRSDLLDLRMPR